MLWTHAYTVMLSGENEKTQMLDMVLDQIHAFVIFSNQEFP